MKRPKITRRNTLKDYLDHINKTLKKVKLDKYSRVQKITFNELFPYRDDKKCRCGCNKVVIYPKRFWASKDCSSRASMTYLFLKGDSTTIRYLVRERDKKVCIVCKKKIEIGEDWDADHIVPVKQGGGGCSLDNFQTLCKYHHKQKHKSKNGKNNKC